MTPCTHNICGRRTLALPSYTADSNMPRSDAFSDDGKLMDLKTTLYSQDAAVGSSGFIYREYDANTQAFTDNLMINVQFSNEKYEVLDNKCSLGVEVAHDPANSDATLQRSPNEYVAGDTLDQDYTGATTLAQPLEYPDCSKDGGCTDADYTNAGTSLDITIPPSSYPHRYEDSSGAKLHVGRLGVTIKPYLICRGVGATSSSQQNVRIYLEEVFDNAADETGVTAHPIHYDLRADGSSLTSKDDAGDEAGNDVGSIAGTLKDGADGQRLYEYSADFVHYHDQVRFPNASIAGYTHDSHFETVATPSAATCQWNHGTFVAGINQAALVTNGWMTASDTAVPETAYGAWTADECREDGVCAKYRKDAVVSSNTAYLPFDKPLASYYEENAGPKIECKSQKDAGVVGTAALSSIAPDLENDNAPSIVASVVTTFDSAVNQACTLNGVNAEICDTADQDTMKVKGQLFEFARVTQDFTDLLTDQYDFRATYTCTSTRTATDNTDECVIAAGADSTVQKLATLKRVDGGVAFADQLLAKATAVENIEFSVPVLYGTTFDNFKASIGAQHNAPTTTDSAHKYRATGDFDVKMLLLNDDTADTAGQELVQWNGGPKVDAKDFEGYFTTTRFTARTPEILTNVRVKAAAISGYFVPNANFASIDDGNGTVVGLMTPFNDVGDLALSADVTEKDKLEGKNDDLTQPMSESNKFWAVKSYCCGRDDTVTVDGADVDCSKVNAAGGAALAGSSVYCRTNGFDVVRCLSSELDVKYTVTTQTLDDRFTSDTKIATKTYVEGATASLSQADQGFVVANDAFNAITVGAGLQAGANKFTYSISTTHMGTATAEFDRVFPAVEDESYNCESVGRDITYSVAIQTPCGESDRSETAPYQLEATVEAHYVYTTGQGGTKDQVSQSTATATIAGYDKNTGSETHTSGEHWETTEWRVQDSSAATSAAKGSNRPVELKVVISNAYPTGATNEEKALHMPTDKVFIVNDTTLKVTEGAGEVALQGCTTENGETYCILEYRNDEVMSIDAGKYCGDLGDDNAVGGEGVNKDQPACPVIEYTIAARVKNGNLANAFGEAKACGAQDEEVALTQIGGVRSHTLFVLGNDRAYDGVIDVHVAEKDDFCEAFCTAAGDGYAGQECYNFPDDPNATPPWLAPSNNNDDSGTYCRNPRPLASEEVHDVAVPGKDGAAATILDPVASGQITTSKDLTFEVRYWQIGNGDRKFIIDGLELPQALKDAGLPAPVVCVAGDYASANGCVGANDGEDKGTETRLVSNGCKNGEEYCADDPDQMRISSFYIALGADKAYDVCQNTNVGDDPYTLDDGTMTLGFSIRVQYLANNRRNGDPDDDVPHNFYFKLACPQKAYSMNLVKFGGDANDLRKNIPANADIGLVDKRHYGESHYKFMSILTYFAGRSSDRYDAGNNNEKCEADSTDPNCHKAAIRMVANENVKFKSNEDGSDVTEVFLDSADTFETKQELAFEFTKSCLFTTITLISKATPFDGDGNFITTAAGDTQFSFRIQCPRWIEDASSDAVVLHYDVEGTTFDTGGGSVSVTEPVKNTKMVNDFSSITSYLKGDLCVQDENLLDVPQECVFPTAQPGEVSTLSKNGDEDTQQTWLNYLLGCGFTLDTQTGNYVGFMQRNYVRENLGAVLGEDKGTQTYCSGRKLSFGIETQGTHTATIRVDAPLEMDFAVQIDKLEWSEDGCTSSTDGNGNEIKQYKMLAEATLYRRTYTSTRNGAWYPATASIFTDITLNDNFFGTPGITDTEGRLVIVGECQALQPDYSNCEDFTKEREVDFGAFYSQFGVDYRANLGIDLQMSCPRGTKQGSDSGSVALRHTVHCSDYAEAAMSDCLADENDANIAVVGADGQIQLTLIIDDTAFFDHTVYAPTYKVTAGTLAGAAAQGNVEDLCDASQVDCMFRANDGTTDINLVTERTYPSDPVLIGGEEYDFSNRDPEENSVVTLRALPLSDTTVEITWVVDRVLQSGERRRLRASYELGAAASNGQDGAAFKVLPATREEEAGIAASETQEETQEVAVEETSAKDVKEKKKDDEEGSSALMTAVWIIVGLVLVIAFGAIIMKRSKEISDGKKGVSNEKISGTNFMQSRFYSYSRLDKDMDHHVENLWKRNRFNSKESRFL